MHQSYKTPSSKDSRKFGWATFVTVAGGALGGGGGGLKQVHGAPQQGAARVGAATLRAAGLGASVHHWLMGGMGGSLWLRASDWLAGSFSTMHHFPLVLLVDGGALAEEGREQEDQEGSHHSASGVEVR